MANNLIDSTINKNEYSLDFKTNISLTLFWAGFIVYSLIYTVAIIDLFSFNSIIIVQMFQFFGIFLFILATFNLIRFKIENTYLMVVFIFYLIWQFIIIIRGFIFDVDLIKTSLLDSWFGIFIYFVPLLLLFPRQMAAYKKLFNVILILGIFSVACDLLFINELLSYGSNRRSQAIVEYFSRNLSIPCGFILLAYIYNSDKKTLYALFVIILTFVLAAIRARRSLMFLSIGIMVIAYLIFYFTNRGKVLKIIFSVFMVLCLLGYGAYVYISQKSGAFGLLTSRLHEDTRSGVIRNFYADMSTSDMIFGRGINGQYFCPGIDEGFRVTTYRFVIENGYLQIILKGGIISLALFLLIAIPAIIKGLFKSNNILSKAAALWILWFICNLFAAVGNVFNMNYILVWISIGICYESSIRAKTNEDIMSELL